MSQVGCRQWGCDMKHLNGLGLQAYPTVCYPAAPAPCRQVASSTCSSIVATCMAVICNRRPHGWHSFGPAAADECYTLGAALLTSYQLAVICHCFAVGILQPKLTSAWSPAHLQEIAWFDQPENSSGTIAGRLATDTLHIRGAVGDVLGLISQNIVTVLAAFVSLHSPLSSAMGASPELLDDYAVHARHHTLQVMHAGDRFEQFQKMANHSIC